MPKFSIIYCVNKSNPWIVESLESIFNQSFTDFEFLICANSCTDDFYDWISDVCSHIKNIKIYRTEIPQLAFSINYLVEKSSGEYLVRMDSDDISLPNRLQRLNEVLTANNLDILGSAVTVIDENSCPIKNIYYPTTYREIISKMTYSSVFCHPAVVIRRSFLISIGGYLGGFKSEDYDLWLRSVKNTRRIANLDEILFYYRIHSNQTTKSLMAYSEVASYWLRELLQSLSLWSSIGLMFALLKTIRYRIMRFIRGCN